jgi:hypothetical protein
MVPSRKQGYLLQAVVLLVRGNMLEDGTLCRVKYLLPPDSSLVRGYVYAIHA